MREEGLSEMRGHVIVFVKTNNTLRAHIYMFRAICQYAQGVGGDGGRWEGRCEGRKGRWEGREGGIEREGNN